jgi:PAS domain S-box-containing protein
VTPASDRPPAWEAVTPETPRDPPVTDPTALLDSVLRSSADYSIIAADHDLKVRLWNEGARRIYGYAPEEVLGKDARILNQPEDVASGKVDQILTQTLRLGKWEGLLTRRRQNGESFPARVAFSVLRGEFGDPKGFLIVSKDLSEEERMQRRVSEAEALTRGVFESGVEALVTTNPLGIITEVNQRVEQLTGRTRAQLIGTPLKDYFADPELAEDGVRRALSESRVADLELALRTKDGLETLVELDATTFLGPDGVPRGVVAAVRDLTQRRQLESELLESRNFSRGLIENSLDALVTLDLHGVITDLNQPMAEATGFSREELIGRPLASNFTEPERVADALKEATRSDYVSNYNLTLKTRNGARRVVSFHASVSRDLGGHPAAVVATARDITVQEQRREMLEERNRDLEIQNRAAREANRLKSEFLASMSHELRTPLDSIIGFSDFLLAKGGSNLTDDQRECLGDILNSGNHLLQLINDILDLAKIESGKMEISVKEFSPKKALNEVCSVLKPMVAEKQLQLSTQVGAGIDLVTLDPLRFKQILYNLLSNSLKFTDPGGRVSVSIVARGESKFAVIVQDNGIGISPANLPRLFQEFEQLDSGPARRYQGSGLGLSLTKKLVELHGGEIHAESLLGHGATFTVILPYRAAASPQGGNKPRKTT